MTKGPPSPSETSPRAALTPIPDVRARVAALVTPRGGEEHVPLAQTRGRVLAEPLRAARALPVFDHSAMDGYALALARGAESYHVVGRAAAGSGRAAALRPGEALRIFTGAPIPEGADAVVMQENVARAADRIRPLRPVVPGDNIRHAGEDVAAGARLAPTGTRVDARLIALAAATGMTGLVVRPRLRIALVSTGDELVAPGQPLAPGQIYDSNRPMLAAVLERPAVEIDDHGILPDDRARLVALLRDLAASHDMVVTTGGASVGDEDHLARAVTEAGGRIEIARAAIRPGKPFTFGTLGAVPIAILPGNPFAALVAALLFVRPMIDRGLGIAPAPFTPRPAEAGFACPRTRERTEFLPARIVGTGALGQPVIERLGRGGSARLAPLIEADGLAVIAPGEAPVAPGDPVGFLPFGGAFSL